MNRITVIGCPGSAKSTFARGLCDKTGLALYYLDMAWHKSDKTKISGEKFYKKFKQWIFDTPKNVFRKFTICRNNTKIKMQIYLKQEKMIKGGRVFTPNVNPRFSILNPEYTYSVPKYQMVSGVFDIMSHLMEQYFSGDDNNTTDYVIEGVMESLINATRKARIHKQCILV